MKYIWVKEPYKYNNKIIFKYECQGNEDKLLLACSDTFTIYFDDEFASYGPERTASGYARVKELPLPKGIKEISIIVFRYGISNFEVDDQDGFLAIEAKSGEKIIGDSNDLKAYSSSKFKNRSCKYSYQRGFVERFDLENEKLTPLKIQNVGYRKELPGISDTCSYSSLKFEFKGHRDFEGFDFVKLPSYMSNPTFKEINQFDVQKEFIEETKAGYQVYEYDLQEIKSGLIDIDIESQEDGKAFIVFEEYLQNGKWTFGRSSCNDLLTIDVKKGHHHIITSAVYCLRFLRVITNVKNIKFKLGYILIQNDKVSYPEKTGDKKIDTILEAACNTYKQNAVDLFTDCPGRERGGWLCDSYFTSLTEYALTGRNDIERNFLENIILGKYAEIEKGMLPMVFPATDTTFIPNWAMFFVLELEQYYLRTKDSSLVEQAKDKVIGLAKYFEKFENEYGLLENLHSWVFVEWSAAGTEEYVEGLSFATNMLYKAMLESISHLYSDDSYQKKANVVKDNINKLSFNCKLYIDNAIRKDGKLVPIKEHTSETCQYYALFFGINEDKNFINFIKDNFGPLRKKGTYPEVAPSNSFIGNYLRFLWLKKLGENERIKKECLDYFYEMAIYGNTLWEKNVPNASCNHGFASSIIYILLGK